MPCHDYKIRCKDKSGEHVTEFIDYTKAMKLFNEKMDEKTLVTEWCDMEDWGDPEEDIYGDEDVKVVHRFTRRVDTVFGMRLITPYFIEMR